VDDAVAAESACSAAREMKMKYLTKGSALEAALAIQPVQLAHHVGQASACGGLEPDFLRLRLQPGAIRKPEKFVAYRKRRPERPPWASCARLDKLKHVLHSNAVTRRRRRGRLVANGQTPAAA